MELPANYDQFCANGRTRWKDQRAHPYLAAYWPGVIAVDRMSREQLLELRDKRLTDLVNHAVENVPFYREWAKESGFSIGDPVRLDALPVVTKDHYRANMEAFQSAAFDPAKLSLSKTSGSSGEPFRFRTHRQASDHTYACLWRNLGRHGLRPGTRRAYVWGRSWSFSTRGLARIKTRLRLALRDWLNNSTTVNAYELTDQNVARSVTQIEKFNPVYMHGYVSAIYTLARHIVQRGRPLANVKLQAVVTESEKLYDFQRQTIAQAFGCPVLEIYGSVEMGSIAAPDPDGHFRINEDQYVIETGPGGQAVLTNLFSHAFPFIRYRLGDMIELNDEVPPGLPYATIKRVIGRTVDLIPIPAGGYIHGVALAHVIDPHLAYVLKYQIHQTALDRFIIRLITRSALPDASQQKIIADMKSLVGQQTHVDIESVDHIAPAASGKFRWVMSDVSDVAARQLAESA